MTKLISKKGSRQYESGSSFFLLYRMVYGMQGLSSRMTNCKERILMAVVVLSARYLLFVTCCVAVIVMLPSSFGSFFWRPPIFGDTITYVTRTFYLRLRILLSYRYCNQTRKAHDTPCCLSNHVLLPNRSLVLLPC